MRNMYQKGWVDICAIDKCLKLCGIVAIGKSYDLLHALHCVHFRDMPTELAERVPTLMRDVFNGMSVDELMQLTAPGEKRNGSALLKLN